MADEQKPEQSEESETVRLLTAVCREADKTFERVGGGTRHWVRDCFLPLLNANGWELRKPADLAEANAEAEYQTRTAYTLREAYAEQAALLSEKDTALQRLTSDVAMWKEAYEGTYHAQEQREWQVERTHTAQACEELRAALRAAQEEVARLSRKWVCFHCGESFDNPGAAEAHFGSTPESQAGCLIDQIATEEGGKPERGRGLLIALRAAQDEIARLKHDVELARTSYAVAISNEMSVMQREAAALQARPEKTP